MTLSFPYPLVKTLWLAQHIGDKNVRIIDSSWRLPGAADSGAQAYADRHIPGAVFFDLDEISDKSTSLPHMLPSRAQFELAVGELGVSQNDRVIVYDDAGIFSAARVWWTFRAMGHRDVSVLDGGLPKWLAEGRPTTSQITPVKKVKYAAGEPLAQAAPAADVNAALDRDDVVVIDARPRDRFFGRAPEPRPGLRSGHMPGAGNLPHSALLAKDGTMLGVDDMKPLFAGLGVSPDRLVITSCGSGVTAAVLTLALEALGHQRHALYDGSWAEWGIAGNDPDKFPVAAG
ncbi:MAG: 3-mercaptopyruvate sulfurtransferase [Parvularculaceae bacterium]|nr:3-mercaptopyruvate sulfurtransferase [Parvularculaceae bacterium]